MSTTADPHLSSDPQDIPILSTDIPNLSTDILG